MGGQPLLSLRRLLAQLILALAQKVPALAASLSRHACCLLTGHVGRVLSGLDAAVTQVGGLILNHVGGVLLRRQRRQRRVMQRRHGRRRVVLSHRVISLDKAPGHQSMTWAYISMCGAVGRNGAADCSAYKVSLRVKLTPKAYVVHSGRGVRHRTAPENSLGCCAPGRNCPATPQARDQADGTDQAMSAARDQAWRSSCPS